MEQKFLAFVVALIMLLAPAAQAAEIHEASATVVGNLLSGNMILAPLALLMLIIALMIWLSITLIRTLSSQLTATL